MAFDNIGFITIAAPPDNEPANMGVQFFADAGAVYIGPHLIFEPGQVMVDQQRTLRTDDGQFQYFATFHNLGNRVVSFTMTGGGFV